MSSASAPACANWRKVVLSLNLIRCHNHLPSFRYELKQAICTKGELVMSYSGSRSSVRMNEIRRWRWATSRNENIREIFVFLLSPLLSPVHSFVLFSLFFLPLQHSDYTENKKISDKVSFSSLKHTHTHHTFARTLMFACLPRWMKSSSLTNSPAIYDIGRGMVHLIKKYGVESIQSSAALLSSILQCSPFRQFFFFCSFKVFACRSHSS